MNMNIGADWYEEVTRRLEEKTKIPMPIFFWSPDSAFLNAANAVCEANKIDEALAKMFWYRLLCDYLGFEQMCKLGGLLILSAEVEISNKMSLVLASDLTLERILEVENYHDDIEGAYELLGVWVEDCKEEFSRSHKDFHANDPSVGGLFSLPWKVASGDKDTFKKQIESICERIADFGVGSVGGERFTVQINSENLGNVEFELEFWHRNEDWDLKAWLFQPERAVYAYTEGLPPVHICSNIQSIRPIQDFFGLSPISSKNKIAEALNRLKFSLTPPKS